MGFWGFGVAVQKVLKAQRDVEAERDIREQVHRRLPKAPARWAAGAAAR